MTPEAAADLAHRVGRQVAAVGVPGCAMAIWHQGHTARAAFGFADLRTRTPMTPETVLHLFSGTKLYTAAALMLLATRGRLTLDAPVRDYLPSLDMRHPVTLRQLASHASGLPDTLRAFMAVHLPGDPVPTTGDALRRYDVTRGTLPGRRVAYRNVNYALLGEVISTLAGIPFEAFVTRELLAPLGSRATFEFTPDQVRMAAVGYVPRFSPMRLLLPVLLQGVASRLEDGRDRGLVRLRPFSLDTAAIGGLLGRAEDFLPLAV
ncbi:MAG: serine hydrolase domain-containing protein, partial [Vicinamibacterales bacterium]